MQGFGIGQYDVLFATNVLHATRDMGNTLQHCKALLRKGGLLIANELTTKTEFLTLTFGLTDGWWLYDDVERRIPGSPILSRHARVSSPKCPVPTAGQHWQCGSVNALHLARLCQGSFVSFLLISEYFFQVSMDEHACT